MIIPPKAFDPLVDRVAKLFGPGGFPCPLCGGKRWLVLDKVYELREFNEGRRANIQVLVLVCCGTCPNRLTLDAQGLDVIDNSGRLKIPGELRAVPAVNAATDVEPATPPE
jgi:hypothetical protein